MKELGSGREAAERGWEEFLSGVFIFAICYIIVYILLLSFYNYVLGSTLSTGGLATHIPAAVIVPCVTSLISAFVGVGFFIIFSGKLSKVFLTTSLLALTITFYNYLYFITLSRGMAVTVLPLFDLLSNDDHAVFSLDLGQVSLLGIVYVCREEILDFLRARTSKSK